MRARSAIQLFTRLFIDQSLQNVVGDEGSDRVPVLVAFHEQGRRAPDMCRLAQRHILVDGRFHARVCEQLLHFRQFRRRQYSRDNGLDIAGGRPLVLLLEESVGYLLVFMNGPGGIGPTGCFAGVG